MTKLLIIATYKHVLCFLIRISTSPHILFVKYTMNSSLKLLRGSVCIARKFRTILKCLPVLVCLYTVFHEYTITYCPSIRHIATLPAVLLQILKTNALTELFSNLIYDRCLKCKTVNSKFVMLM